MMNYSLPDGVETLEKGLQHLDQKSVTKRIWDHDHTVWDPDPAEISNRLGWLNIPKVMKESIRRLSALRDSLINDGIDRVFVLGMGGSSLAPDVFQRVFETDESYPVLEVLDTTHPDAIDAARTRTNLPKTAFIVATKSGTTVETLSLFRYFYNQVQEVVGEGDTGDHFIAITDPGSQLVDLAEKLGFRDTFINDPNIGGRYSALSFFGLVPASIIGMDLESMLANALEMRRRLAPNVKAVENPGAILGTILGTMANQGRNKLTFLASAKVEPVGDWIEQLIAESTGKQGKGILPVVGEPCGDPDVYAADRIFVHLRWQGDQALAPLLEALNSAGHPSVTFDIEDVSSLGGLFYQWEFATAIAGYWLDINPFDQPNVESAKNRAKEMVAAFREKGELPTEQAAVEIDHAALYTSVPGISDQRGSFSTNSIESALIKFLDAGVDGGYLSIQAYLSSNEELTESLRSFQGKVRDVVGIATTIGYGPRFLHSTGQLHKGDGGSGLFLQLTDEKSTPLEVPDTAGSPGSSISFDTLIDAQAMGDRRALVDAERKVMRIHFKEHPTQLLESLLKVIDEDA